MRDLYVSDIYILSRYDACGNTSVNEKFYYNNLNNFSLQVSSGKSWKQYTLSSAGILCGECLCKHTYLSWKGKLWVVGIFFVSFSFQALLRSQDRGSLIRNWEWKKEIIRSGTNLSRCSFFLIAAFFLSCRVLVIHDRTVKDPR